MKENRILCIEVSGECQHLMNVNRLSLAHLCGSSLGLYCTKNISWKPITKDACKNCKEGRYQGFTKEQAIRKMCDGYFKAKDAGKTESERVETALNALLEGHDYEKEH